MSDEQDAQLADENGADQTDEPTDDAESTTDTSEGVEEGDFVELSYTARTAEGGELVDTTDEDVAEESGVDTDQQTFEPRTIVLGSNQIFEPVDEDIRGHEVGDTGSVVVDAEDAFGEHDSEEIETIKTDRIPEDDMYPGAPVEIDSRQGYVERIIGGRARVDFNHPLAGQEIEYEYEILDTVEDSLERARGIVSTAVEAEPPMYIETDEVEEEVTVESDDDEEDPETKTELVEKETLYIEPTQELEYNQQWLMQKSMIGQELIDRVEIDRVIVQDIIDGESGGMFGGMGGAGGVSPEELAEEIDDEELDVDADDIAETLDAEDTDE